MTFQLKLVNKSFFVEPDGKMHPFRFPVGTLGSIHLGDVWIMLGVFERAPLCKVGDAPVCDGSSFWVYI